MTGCCARLRQCTNLHNIEIRWLHLRCPDVSSSRLLYLTIALSLSHRREEVLRSDGRQEVRWFLSDPHGTSWLAVAGLKGDQAGAAAPGQAFIAQGSFVTRTPFSSATEAGVEAFLQQILRATGKPLPPQQTGGEHQLPPCIACLALPSAALLTHHTTCR